MAAGSQEIPELDRAGLREFGLTTGAVLAALFGLLLPWLLEFSYPLWPWMIAGVLAVWALIGPGTLRPVYRTWMRFGLLLNRITTPLILGMIFFLLITPTGWILRLLGRDPMSRRFDRSARSYRIRSEKPPKENMEKPF